MKKSIIALATMAAISGPVLAENHKSWEVSGEVTATTDYRFRGVSQSDENPALQGGVQVDWDTGFYVGAWASSVDFGSGVDTDIETNLYVGYTEQLDSVWSYDVGALYYIYDGNDAKDYHEFYGSLTADYDTMGRPSEATVGVAYTNDFGGVSEDQYYVYADYSVEVINNLDIDLHVGHTEFDTFQEYTDWSAGVSTEQFGLDWSLAYVDTDTGWSAGDETIVLSVGYGF